jgi:hypothetical protein
MDLSNMFPRQATTHDLKILEKRLGQKARASLKNQGSMNKRIYELEEQLAKMTLLCRTLSDVVVRKGIVALDEFVEIMDEIDLDDGVADGQVTPERNRSKPMNQTKTKRSKASYRSKKKTKRPKVTYRAKKKIVLPRKKRR